VLVACGTSKPAPGKAESRAAVVVELGDYFFRPARVTVHVGQAVRFVNVGKIPHTVADRRRGASVPSSRLIKPHQLDPGDAQTVVFRRPGTVSYFCTFHPTLMAGQISVVR
jgi:plastocyanin